MWWRESWMDSTLLVPLETEPFPVLVRTSAPNTGLFPKLTAFTFLTQKKKPNNVTFCVLVRETHEQKNAWKREMVGGGDGDKDIMWNSLCLLPACRRAFKGVWGGIYGNRPQINWNQSCGVSICLCPGLFWGGKTWDYSFSVLGKSFTVCCHPFGVEHLSSICISNMWSDHETDALWPWTNWYSKVIKPRSLFKLWPFDHLTITGW